MSCFSVQPLESRMFLSGTTTTTPNPIIVADRKQLHTDEQTLYTDRRNGDKTIDADYRAINAELKKLPTIDPNLATDLKPFKDKLAADQKAAHTAIVADLKAIQTAGAADQKTLAADYQQLWTDIKAKNTTAIANDKAKIKTDLAKLKTDTAPARATLQADEKKWDATIKADHQAILAEEEKLDREVIHARRPQDVTLARG